MYVMKIFGTFEITSIKIYFIFVKSG